MHAKRTQIGIAAQLFLSYCLAGGIAAIALMRLAPLHLPALTLIVYAGLAGGGVGLLLTFNIQLGLSRVDWALLSLTHGQAAEGLEKGGNGR